MLEGESAHDKCVEDHSQGENISSFWAVFFLWTSSGCMNLRSHVSSFGSFVVINKCLFFYFHGKSKISNFDGESLILEIFCDKNIIQFDVPMNNMMITVQIREGMCQLPEQKSSMRVC